MEKAHLRYPGLFMTVYESRGMRTSLPFLREIKHHPQSGWCLTSHSFFMHQRGFVFHAAGLFLCNELFLRTASPKTLEATILL